MRLLIVKTSSMGDVIHTLPALTDVEHNVADLHCSWLVEEGFQEIPKWHRAVDTVIPVALRRWRKQPLIAWRHGEIQSFWRQLRAEQYDYILDAQGLLKSALLTSAAKGQSCGLAWGSIREPIASIFYRHKYTVAKEQHAVTRIRQLFAQALGYPEPVTFPDYGIDKSRLLPNAIPDATISDEYLIFIHGTSRADKCWPVALWIDLAKLAASSGLNICLPWGNQEELQRSELIAQNCKNAIVLPKLGLSAIAALLINAKSCVAVDTGLGHLAAALSVPTVSLYGPTDPKLIGAYGENQVHLTDFLQLSAQQVWDEIA